MCIEVEEEVEEGGCLDLVNVEASCRSLVSGFRGQF